MFLFINHDKTLNLLGMGVAVVCIGDDSLQLVQVDEFRAGLNFFRDLLVKVFAVFFVRLEMGRYATLICDILTLESRRK